MNTSNYTHELGSPEFCAFFEKNGFVVARALFSNEETEQLRQHFMELRASGPLPGDFAGVDLSSSDPLKAFPRMVHMHHWDETSRKWLLDVRLDQALGALLGVPPLAVQSMVYFKPPGARGQALHQDNFYLRAKPENCIAAWLALDKCDTQNGCMQVVPGSHEWSLLCPAPADTSWSFTDVSVDLPPHAEVLAVEMEPGDTLFFNGTLVHGSYANHSSERFRRALIGHYIDSRSTQVGAFYSPVLAMDGTAVEIHHSQEGGRCGVWVERDGTPVVEFSGVIEASDITEAGIPATVLT